MINYPLSETITAVVHRHPFLHACRDTKKGDKYSVWKLSDLSGQSAVVSVFLFGQAYQEHWKTSLGYIVALLNPSILPDREVCVWGCVGVCDNP